MCAPWWSLDRAPDSHPDVHEHLTELVPEPGSGHAVEQEVQGVVGVHDEVGAGVEQVLTVVVTAGEKIRL